MYFNVFTYKIKILLKTFLLKTFGPTEMRLPNGFYSNPNIKLSKRLCFALKWTANEFEMYLQKLIKRVHVNSKNFNHWTGNKCCHTAKREISIFKRIWLDCREKRADDEFEVVRWVENLIKKFIECWCCCESPFGCLRHSECACAKRESDRLVRKLRTNTSSNIIYSVSICVGWHQQQHQNQLNQPTIQTQRNEMETGLRHIRNAKLGRLENMCIKNNAIEQLSIMFKHG